MSTRTTAQPVNWNDRPAKKLTSGLFMALSAVALLVVAAFTFRSAILTSAAVSASDRSAAADAARWNGRAQLFAQQAAARERSVAADAARWNALAQYYARQATGLDRGALADAARWNGRAEYYAQRAATP